MSSVEEILEDPNPHKPYPMESFFTGLQQLNQNFNHPLLERLLQHALAFYQTGQDKHKEQNYRKSLMSFSICYQMLSHIYKIYQKECPSSEKRPELIHKIRKAYERTFQHTQQLNKLISQEEEIKEQFDMQHIDIVYQRFIQKYLILPFQYPGLHFREAGGLLIYGNTGCGKTYLFKSIQRFFQQHLSHLPFFSLTSSSDINVLNQCDIQQAGIILVDDLDSWEEETQHTVSQQLRTWLLTPECATTIVIGTSYPENIMPSLLSLLTEKLRLHYPSLSDTHRYLQNRFKWSGIEVDKMNQLALSLHQKKYNYTEIEAVIRKAMNVATQAALHHNVFFQDLQEHSPEKTLLFFTSKLSISNTTSKKTDALSRLQKDQLLRLRPTGYSHVYMCSDGSVCQEIKREGQGVAHQPPPQQLTYVHQDFLPNFPSLEDERIRHVYVRESQTKSSTKTPTEWDVIVHFPVEVTNENETSHEMLAMATQVLNLYVCWIQQIIQHHSRINLKSSYATPHLKQLVEELSHDSNHPLHSLTRLHDLEQLSRENRKLLSKALPLHWDSQQHVFDLFHECFHPLHQTILTLYDEDGIEDRVFHLRYGKRDTRQWTPYQKGLPLHIDADEMRKVVLGLLSGYAITKDVDFVQIEGIKVDVEVSKVKMNQGMMWHITILPDFSVKKNLTFSYLYPHSQDPSVQVRAWGGMNVSSGLFPLPEDYTITNEQDIDLLQENFPVEYEEVYREDETTWKTQPLKSETHLRYMTQRYTTQQQFYCQLYHRILMFQQHYLPMLNTEQKEDINDFLGDLQFKIDEMFLITEEYDGTEWNGLWNLSSNHPDKITLPEGTTAQEKDEEEDEDVLTYEYHQHLVKRHQDYFISPHFLFQLYHITRSSHQLENMSHYLQYYLIHRHHQYFRRTYHVFLKSSVLHKEAASFYHSRYLTENSLYHPSKKEVNRDYVQLLHDKFVQGESLYSHLWERAEAIGFTEKSSLSHVRWYQWDDMSYLHHLLETGLFNIQNKSLDILSLFLEGIHHHRWLSIFTAQYIATSHYHKFHQVGKSSKLFWAVLLYPSQYYSHHLNSRLTSLSMPELLGRDVVDPAIRAKYLFLRKMMKDISVPEAPTHIPHMLESHTNITSLIHANPEAENMEQYERSIYQQFHLYPEQIQSSLRATHLRPQYIEESVLETEASYSQQEEARLVQFETQDIDGIVRETRKKTK